MIGLLLPVLRRLVLMTVRLVANLGVCALRMWPSIRFVSGTRLVLRCLMKHDVLCSVLCLGVVIMRNDALELPSSVQAVIVCLWKLLNTALIVFMNVLRLVSNRVLRTPARILVNSLKFVFSS